MNIEGFQITARQPESLPGRDWMGRGLALCGGLVAAVAANSRILGGADVLPSAALLKATMDHLTIDIENTIIPRNNFD